MVSGCIKLMAFLGRGAEFMLGAINIFMLNKLGLRVLPKCLNPSKMQKLSFCVPKSAVLEADMCRFAARNSTFCAAKA